MKKLINPHISIRYADVLNILREGAAVFKGNNVLFKNTALIDLLGEDNKRIRQIIKKASGYATRKLRISSRTGAIRDVEVKIKTTGAYSLIFLDDITAMEEQKRQVELSERLSSLGEMAAGVAHEIKNPLSAIRGYVELMLEERAAPVADTEKLNKIVDEITILSDKINRFLDFAKPINLNLQTVSIEELVEEALFFTIGSSNRKKIKIRENIDSKLRIIGDYALLKQVLINLILNSIDALDFEGEIILNALMANPAGSKKFVKIEVVDNGKGIDIDNYNKIFNPFFSTKFKTEEKFGGTGLGLSIAYRIIDRHGGLLEFDSEKGRGTIFSIYLPVKQV